MFRFPILAFILSVVGSVFAGKSCKCLPGDSCYPSQPTWDAFSKTLTQPLISNQKPLASPCYPSSANFDASVCDFVTGNQFNTALLSDTPGAVQWTIWEALITNGTVQQCPFSPGPHDQCFQGRVPVVSVNATSVKDIQETISFASKHNLKLVIRNAGHELLGRSFGVGALELFTHNMRGIVFDDNFVPAGAPVHTKGQPAVHLNAGETWADVYVAADEHGRSVPGGFSVGGTVGAAGGWSLGGGHSVLSPFLGLGVDNVLEYSVVLPNASAITANQFQHSDLFWALRGGGGPSFGVATSTTFKTHPNDPYTVAFFVSSANSTVAFKNLMTAWMSIHNNVSDAGWSGTWPFGGNSLFLTMFTPTNGPFPNANKTLQSFFDTASKIPGINVTVAETVRYASWEQFNFDNLVDSSLGQGLNFSNALQGGIQVFESSWILPREFTSETNATNAVNLFMDFTVSALAWMLGGGAVAAVNPDATAANPAFRHAVSDIILSPTQNTTSNLTNIEAMRQLVHDQMKPIQQAAPNGGQYLNEPDYLEEIWQKAYWGTHYPRLLAIKKEVDPHDLLIVFKGVNSEQWDPEILCKTT